MYHFARVGLPKYAFGPLFSTLAASYPGTMAQISQTEGYYWMNASWGVSSFNGTFAYMCDNGVEKLSNLVDVMRMLAGRLSLCLGTLAISITCPAKMVDGKPTMDTSSYGLSVKLHNAFHIDTVDYHRPPQQGLTGMTIPSRIAKNAKVMTRAGVMSVGGGSSIFANANKGIFGQANAAPPTVKSSNDSNYMA